MSLADKQCVPCHGGVQPLKGEALKTFAAQVPEWQVVNDHHLTRHYTFPDFAQALAFVNRAGAVAEEQGHHPDLLVGWGKVEVEIWTHSIGGLSESDFILAAKIEQLARK
ncbi:MAG TPA: 4a-hydroxytetrahydrobiopterin dehydratase [Candidatus Limnocylindrales bacterium]|nr:4a-hydroxytetrahydrobiopterin dehydratase [Candidatus Limnocylindrales bacterium]